MTNRCLEVNKKVQITAKAQQNNSGLGIKFSSVCSKEEDGVINKRVRRVMYIIRSDIFDIPTPTPEMVILRKGSG